ncbi:TonB-dependent receptor plug domain-containing protein [Phenylobacterium sp.]|jgi:hypothetical protein|uniref:TonB-dependent receptor plug domain-containing protein n=1 Tax=Phenylobacterium sp. TaxID=1871053 RepID=UPI0037CB8C55
MKYRIAISIAAMIGWCSPSSAQTAADSTARASYPAAFFADVQAQNALDMLDRVPGFTLVASENLRGFGDAAGNVLINGARPATKDVMLSEVLRRIPARTVERIDLLDGAATGLQGGGSRLVANVILKGSAGSSGTLRLRGQTTQGDRFGPSAAGSWKGSLGGAALSASLKGGTDGLTLLSGQQRLVDGLGTAIESGPLIDRRSYTNYAGSLSVAAPIAGVSTTLATSLRSSNFRRRSRFDAFPAGTVSPARTQIEADDDPSRSAELSLELKRPVGRGEAKLIGLQTWTNNTVSELAGAEFPSGAIASSRFTSNDNQSESILRATWAPRWPKLAVDVALEGVRTTLVANTDFVQIDNQGTTPLDADRTRVAETRGSAALSANYSGIAEVSIEGTVAIEMSRIAQAEPLQSANTYRFFKPRFVVTWNPTSRTTLSLRAERKVGQLDFGDFVGAQQVADGSSTQTNSALQPSQTDGLRLTAERRWGTRGSVSVTLVGERLTNVIDVRPVGEGQGVGNIPSASSFGVDVLATVPLGFFLRGAELTIDAAWRKTSVRDPFNGAVRPLQGAEFADTTVSYRHIVNPHVTYGGSFSLAPPYRTFRSQLIGEFKRGPDFSIFSEWNIGLATKLRVEVNQLFGSSIDRELTRYNGLRGIAPINSIEIRDRTSRRAFALQIERTF